MQKKKTKYLEMAILLILIATISTIFLLGHNYLKEDIPISNASKNENYSQTKISKYQVILNNVNMYKIPLKGYIDTRNSTYYIYIKSTDNIINNVTEVIDIEYFNPNLYSYEDMRSINNASFAEASSYFKPTETPDTSNENETESPEENNENNELPEDEIINENTEELLPTPTNEITIDEQEMSSIFPINWLDLNNVDYEEFTMNTLTNYCNGYNDIDSYYTTTCTKKDYHLHLYNSYNINSLSGYILKTKKFSVTLPVNRGTKLSDFAKSLEKSGIKLEVVSEIPK